MKGIKLRILNFLFLVVSAISIGWLMLKPFMKLNVDWDCSKESLQQIAGDDLESSLPEGITLDTFFEEGNIPIKVEIQVSNKMLIDVWKAEDSKAFVKNEVIQVNVDKLVEDLNEPLMRVVKSAAKGMVTQVLEEQLQHVLGEGGDLYAALGESGLGEEDVKESVGVVFDALTAEGATVDTVAETLTTEYNKYFDAISEEGDVPMTSEEMAETLEEALGEYGLINEDGTIKDITEALGVLLEALMGTSDSEDSGEDADKNSNAKMLKLFTPNFEETEAEEENPLVKIITDKINEALNDDVINYITLGFKGAGIALAVFILGWALRAILALIKMFSKKPYFPGCIGVIGRIVQIVLSIVCGAVFLLQAGELIAKIPGIGETLVTLLNTVLAMLPIPSGLKLGLQFSTIIPALACLVNFILNRFYKPAKRKFKKESLAE